MNPILTGLLTGLGLSVSTGPVFFTLLQTSLQRGFKSAIFFIVGVSCADTSMILLTWVGLNQVQTGNAQSALLGIMGGILLILFGINFIRKRNDTFHENSSVDTSATHYKFLLKGLSINILNPIVWAFWGAISKYVLESFEDQSQQVGFFASILITVFLADVTKAYFARKLIPVLKSKHITYFSTVIGVLLIVFGSKLLWDYTIGL